MIDRVAVVAVCQRPGLPGDINYIARIDFSQVSDYHYKAEPAPATLAHDFVPLSTPVSDVVKVDGKRSMESKD